MAGQSQNDLIDIDYFEKMKMKVGKVISAETLEKSGKLLKLRISLGDKERTILSGIRKYYKLEDLIGKKVIILDNLKPAKMLGIDSEGMVLAAMDDAGNLSLLSLDKDLKEGSEIS